MEQFVPCYFVIWFLFSMIFLRICNSRAPLDALAARGMRFTSGTHGGRESVDTTPADADDWKWLGTSSCCWLATGDCRVTVVVTGDVSDPGHGLFRCPCLWRRPVALWILKVAQQTHRCLYPLVLSGCAYAHLDMTSTNLLEMTRPPKQGKYGACQCRPMTVRKIRRRK